MNTQRAVQFVAAIVAVVVLSACAGVANSPVRGYIWTSTTTPVTATSHAIQPADRKGEACATSILWLVAWGDASISAAAGKAGITTITSVEASQMGTWTTPLGLPLFEQYCTTVHGR